MSIRGKKKNKKPLFSTKYRLPAVSSCPALLPLHPSWDMAACDLCFCPISVKDDFHTLQWPNSCWEWLSQARQQSGHRHFSVLFLTCSVPCGKPSFFASVGPEPLPFFLFSPPHLSHCFLSCCHLRWAWGTQSFSGKCKLEAALRSVCFLIGKQHLRALRWWQGLQRQAESRNIPCSQAPVV